MLTAVQFAVGLTSLRCAPRAVVSMQMGRPVPDEELLTPWEHQRLMELNQQLRSDMDAIDVQYPYHPEGILRNRREAERQLRQGVPFPYNTDQQFNGVVVPTGFGAAPPYGADAPAEQPNDAKQLIL